MKVRCISAVTLKVRDMKESCDFYSRLPGFKLVYGGAADPFTTFEVGGDKTYLNLELANDPGKRDFGGIIFHIDDVDVLYRYMKNDRAISVATTFETEPADAPRAAATALTACPRFLNWYFSGTNSVFHRYKPLF